MIFTKPRGSLLISALALAENGTFVTRIFRPSANADPYVGARGEVTEVSESRVEAVLPRGRRAAVVAALRAAHPYEEPAFDLWETVGPTPFGIGRIGKLLAPPTGREFA